MSKFRKLTVVLFLSITVMFVVSVSVYAQSKVEKCTPPPLQADGWEGVIVDHLCLKVEQSYPQIEDEFSQPIAETVKRDLERIGMQVVDEEEPCVYTLSFAVTLVARSAWYMPTGSLYTGAEATGRMELASKGRPTLNVSVSQNLAPPSTTRNRPTLPQNAPFHRVWRPAILDGLYKLWGMQVYEKALNAEDFQTGMEAIRALGNIGDARSVESLVTALKDALHFQVREAAAEELKHVGDTRTVELLITTLKDDQHFQVRSTAAEILGEIGDVLTVEPLLAALNDKAPRVRTEAAYALGKIGDTRAFEPLIALLKDKNSGVQVAAASALRSIDNVRAFKPLIAALKDEDFLVRWNAAQALGRLGDLRAVEPLIAALKDEVPRVRARAAQALGRLGDHSAVEPLLVSLKDERAQVRWEATSALESITKQDFGRDQEKWQQWWDENRGEML